MPIFDFPLNELKTYQGTNPCPDDMDSFWDDALAEMNAVDSQVEMAQSDFVAPFAECFDLYFTGVRGARIHAKYIRPKNSKGPSPAVLQFHGYGGDAGPWSEKLQYVAMGFSVAALDCRGQGGTSQDIGGTHGNTQSGQITRGLIDGPENLLFRHIFLDTAQLAKIVMAMDEVDENRVGAIGGSQGGALALVCGALETRIKRLASMYPFLCDYLRVWNMDLTDKVYTDVRSYLRMFDPRHCRKDEIFTDLGYIDVQHLAKRIKGEVLMGTGLMDTTCPPSTQFAAYNKITSPKNMLIYPDFGHEGLPGFYDETFQFMAKL